MLAPTCIAGRRHVLPKRTPALTVVAMITSTPYLRSKALLPLRPLPAVFALSLFLGSSLAWAAPLSVTAQRSIGSVTALVDGARAPLTQGRSLSAGTELQTSGNARAQLNFAGQPTLDLGSASSLLLHSGDASVLRLRLLQGALHVDARPTAAGAARDIRLNIADLRLRVMNAQAWVQQTEAGGQVCLISGRISVQFPTRSDDLDIPGQCLRRAGVETHWVVVPLEVLTERVALTQVGAPALGLKPVAEPTSASSIRPAPAAPVAAPIVAVAAPPPPPPSSPAVAPVMAKPSAESAELAAPKVPVIVLAGPVPEPVMDTAPPAAKSAPIEAAAATEPEVPTEPTAGTVVVSVAEIPEEALPEPASAPEVEVVLATLDAADSSSAADDEADAVQPMAQGDERRWSVVFASMSEAGAAAQEAARLQALGLKAEAREYRVGSRHGFRVGVGRFASREEADAAMNGLLDVHPQLSAWLARY